jgi:predicted AlkP superfamily pyrophosphatase or phosphodiesterase
MLRRSRFRQTACVLALAALVVASVSAGPAEPRRRAVLLSFDGVSGQRLERLLSEPGKLAAGGFRRIAARGFVASRSVPPTPALTAVSHVTIATGALPQATGIVGNTMLDRSRPFGATVSGFEAPIRAETLWEAARRQGKRVGVVYFPGADGTSPARTADWALTWPGNPATRGRLQAVPLSAWQPVGEDPETSYSPVRRAVLPMGASGHSLTLTAVDATDDQTVNYDHLRVESETGAVQDVRSGEWFPLEVRSAESRTGAWCRLMALAPDLSKVEVYVGPLGHNTGYPKEFVREVDEKFGFWPGAGDRETFGVGSEHPELYVEQVERLAAFATRVQVWAASRQDWDLLLCYQSEVDSLSHEFLLVDPGQPGFTWERASRYADIVDHAYAIADGALDALDRALSPADSIFVTSDHGMTPIWTEIFPNELLRRAGLVRLDARGRIDPSSRAVAIVEGAIAHVYVNGSADPALLEQIETALKDLKVRGESPWERILKRSEAGSLGLDAPESGDVIALARPGYHLSRRTPDPATPIGLPTEYGAHGYRNAYPEIQACYLAAGPGIAKGHADSINSWQIASRVAAALGIEPPRNAER